MSEMPKMTHRDEMETLLPFYLNGALSGDDLKHVEDWLASDPGADEALLAAEAEIALIFEDNEAHSPRPDAFQRFSDSLDKVSASAASPMSWLSAFFSKTFAIPAPLLLATAAAAIVLMAVAIANFKSNSPEDVQVAGAGQSANVPFVLVTFSEGATLAEIAKLLTENGSRIESGPASGSAFKIALSAETLTQYDQQSKQLAASPLVEKLIPGKKPDAP
jgi:anti-sigma-K factor RskA